MAFRECSDGMLADLQVLSLKSVNSLSNYLVLGGVSLLTLLRFQTLTHCLWRMFSVMYLTEKLYCSLLSLNSRKGIPVGKKKVTI